MRLDDDFRLVHGASLWGDAKVAAVIQGYEIAEVAPPVCIALVWLGCPALVIPGEPDPMYAGSVGAICTDAGIVLFEWLVVNPNHGLRLRHYTVERLMRAGMVYAAAIGKRVVMLTAHKGVNAMAKRIGLGVVHPEYSVLIGGPNG